MLRLSFIVFVLGALVAGCKPATDLNRPCQLVRRNPDGGTPLPIAEKDVAAKVGANKDFISFGTVECEDLVCVRDTNFKSDAGPDDPAFGYCSRGCQQGSACPSYDSSLDTGPNALGCRALLLDQETLKELSERGLNPGNVRDPFFCARDAGT